MTTETAWLNETDPRLLLEFLGEGFSPRKYRLLACAACRAVWDDTWPLRCRRVVEVAEQYADGVATEQELNNARSLASQTVQNALFRAARQRSDNAMALVAGRQLAFAADAALADRD